MAVAPGLGKVVPLAVGFQLILCSHCFDQFETDVVTDSMSLGFSKLETPEPSPLSLDVYHFHCGYAPVKSEAECMGPENGHCRAGTKCYIKDNAKTKQIYASCCCNQTDTPVDMIERSSRDWSCFASYVDSPSETHGKTPFCDILCCRRPGVSRSCHGNKPICCNAEVGSCGITLQGEPCCAAYHKEANATCCHDVGTTCWYSPASWMVVPFLPGTPCCLEHLPDVTCVSQSNCSEGFGGALGWSGASVLAAAGSQAFFYMKGSGAAFIPGRRWCWYLKMAAPALCLFLALHAVVYLNFLHIWEKVTPAQTAKVCVWWAMWSLVAMQLIVSNGLSLFVTVLRARHRHNQPPAPALARFPPNRRGVRIAILINIEDYLNQRIWSRVYDRSFQALVSQLRENNWQVFPWYDLKKNDVESVLGQVEPHLHGANGPIVWLHISCHAQFVYGCPQFIPADAGGWRGGVPILPLVKNLSTIDGCKNARIHVTLNGCMDIPGWRERLWWGWRLGWNQDDFRISPRRTVKMLRNSDAQAWILFACHPGRRVPGGEEDGGIFTRKILRVLKGHLGDYDSKIEEYYDEIIADLRTTEDGVKFHPYLITTGNARQPEALGLKAPPPPRVDPLRARAAQCAQGLRPAQGSPALRSFCASLARMESSFESSLPRSWDPTIAEAHVRHNISNHDGMWAAIADHCLPFSQGKAVADLGAGDGTLGKLLQAMV
eukprot:s524_g26.t1